MQKLLTLLVEDTPTHQKILTGFLESEGFIVFTVENTAAALRFLTQFKPDILITNLSLPGMTGLELIQRVKGTRNLASIPIVAINNAKTFRPADAIDAGAAAILRKPINLPSLLKTIFQVVSSRPETQIYDSSDARENILVPAGIPDFA